ncbi:hypothetical protein D3C72_2424350 [compost metagenome]
MNDLEPLAVARAVEQRGDPRRDEVALALPVGAREEVRVVHAVRKTVEITARTER